MSRLLPEAVGDKGSVASSFLEEDIWFVFGSNGDWTRDMTARSVSIIPGLRIAPLSVLTLIAMSFCGRLRRPLAGNF